MGAAATRLGEGSGSEPSTPSAASSSSDTISTVDPFSNPTSPFYNDTTPPGAKLRRVSQESTPPRDELRSRLLDMPEEVLMEIFMKLDVDSLSKCYRVCKQLNAFMTSSSAIALRHTLLANSLKLNPHALRARPDMPHQTPPSSVQLLAQLRERLTRFHNLSPSSETEVQFREAEGRLYEYLEGVLLRSPVDFAMMRGLNSTYSRDLAVYDFRKPDEWEEMSVDGDDDDVDEIVDESDLPDTDGVRHYHRENFVIQELAVDPGQDLLLLMTKQVTNADGLRVYTMEIHLLSLTTYKPHPRAEVPVLKFPPLLHPAAFDFEFQICDDALFVLRKIKPPDFELHIPGHFHCPDQLIGWQWTSGRQCLRQEFTRRMDALSLVLLSPTSFIIPSIKEEPMEDVMPGIRRVPSFTHHLDLYAFPPFSELPEDTAEWRPTLVRSLDLPRFTTDALAHHLFPPQLSVRADPPPRQSFPLYPLHAPPAFVPDPTSGVILVSVRRTHLGANEDEEGAHFMFVFPRPLLLSYLPTSLPDYQARLARNVVYRGGSFGLRAISSDDLEALWADVPRTVPWDSLAPNVRALGPEHPLAEWVCYVYQSRHVAVEHVLWQPEDSDSDTDSADGQAVIPHLCVYDFDARRVRKEIEDRLSLLSSEGKTTGNLEQDLEAIEGDWDGIELRIAPDRHEHSVPLDQEVICGGELPYIVARKECVDESTPLIDAERVLLVSKPDPMLEGMGEGDNHGNILIMNF